MTEKILWLSQHDPLLRQIAELKNLFGDIELCQDVNTFKNADEIIRRFREGGYSDLVVVAPYSVIARLTELGIKPIWAQMEQVYKRENAEVTTKGRHYRFVKFRRIIAIRMEFEEIEKKKVN